MIYEPLVHSDGGSGFRVTRRLICGLVGHRPSSLKVWNERRQFAVCDRCDRDIVRSAYRTWRTLPPNMRVVWRSERKRGR